MATLNELVDESPVAKNQGHEICIRSFTAEDYAAIRELFIAGMLGYCPPGENNGLRRYIERSLTQDMANIQGTYFDSGGNFWVATTKDEKNNELIIGSIALEGKGEKRGELRRLSVHKDFRRNGLARKLIAHLEKWATESGFETLLLNTDTDMTIAIKLYESLGFSETHRLLLVAEPRRELLFYEKPLLT